MVSHHEPAGLVVDEIDDSHDSNRPLWPPVEGCKVGDSTLAGGPPPGPGTPMPVPATAHAFSGEPQRPDCGEEDAADGKTPFSLWLELVLGWMSVSQATTASDMPSMARNIVERRHTDSGVQPECSLLAAIMDATDVMLAYLDCDFNFVWANQVYAAACKMPVAELVGRNHFALYPDADNEAIFRGVRDTGQVVFQKDRPFLFPQQPECRVTYWDWSLAPVRDKSGSTVGLVLSLRETTSQVRARQAVRESEERFIAMADAAPVLIWMSGPDQSFTWFNQAWLNYTGRPLTEELGTGWMEGLHPDDGARCRATYDEHFQNRQPFQMDYRLRAANGEYRWIVDRGTPRFSAGGEFLGYIGACADIDERVQAGKVLQAAKTAADRANDAKSRFLAGVSHDLRQPLSALSLHVGALEGALQPALLPSDRHLLSDIKDCVFVLSDMLSNLLDLSRLEAGVVTPNSSNFAVGTLLGRIVASQAPQAQLKGLALRCGHVSLIGRTDPALFHRIVGNLVANAVRYTEHGGVLIACRRRQGKVWVEVWDTGIGIAADKITEIFEEFRQVGAPRAKGTGLGLAIVAKTAALLGLEIRVRSRPGKGSMFAVELPRGEALNAQAPRRYSPRLLRIALVEDNAQVATALTYALGKLGHQVVAAPSLPELMVQLGEAAPDCLISDYCLAGTQTGSEVIAEVRAAFGCELPAMIITGDTEPSLIRRLAEQRIAVQHKPLDIDTLQARLTELTAAASAAA